MATNVAPIGAAPEKVKFQVNAAFGNEIDYAMLIKIYGENVEGQQRYSPAECIGCKRRAVTSNPDQDHIRTSYVERQNLTLRMSMRRFTRLTNGLSKKVDNHAASVALYMMFYNFGRKHTTLGTAPAVKAGIADHIWSVEEIIGLIEKSEPKSTRPEPLLEFQRRRDPAKALNGFNACSSM